MILRKPYAFFIKFFRLFHIILLAIISYLLYKSYLILDFYNEYSSVTINVIGQDLKGELINGLMNMLPFVSLLVLAVILFVLIVKKKPFIFYMYSVACTISLFVMFQIIGINLQDLSERIVDIRTVRLIRDFLFIFFGLNIINLVLLVVRSIGLDVKKFGFKNDLIGLDVSEADREEFEFEIKIDSNLSKRKLRNLIRRVKYAYLENKLLTYIISVFSVVVISLVISSIFIQERNTYNLKEVFIVNGVSVKVLNSYYTKLNHSNELISEDNSYLILELDAKSFNSDEKIDPALVNINIGNYNYSPTIKYKEEFIEFGNLYTNQELTSEFETFILVYEIPTLIINEDIIFEYVNVNIPFDRMGKISVYLEPLMLNDEVIEKQLTLGEEIKLTNVYLQDYGFTLNSFETREYFEVSYKKCIVECYSFKKYIYPQYNTSYDEGIAKLTYSENMSNDFIVDIYNTFDILEKFGSLLYTVDGVEKKFSSFSEVTSTVKEENTIYIELPKEVINATSIKLEIKIRNEIYYYNIK